MSKRTTTSFDIVGREPFDLSMLIDGRWTSGQSEARIKVDNPANESIIATIPEGKAIDGISALESAQNAQKKWAKLPAIERGKLIHKLADVVASNAEKLAHIVTLEQGKPIGQARGEVGATETFIRYAAESARRIEGDIMPSDNPNEEIWIRRVPQGVVLGLTAWNYPLALAARKLGPALVAGNAFVLLAHEITPISGIELARLALEAGLPEGVFNVVTGRGREIGQAMVESPLSDLVTMTGSTRGGREIYRASSELLKPVSLELGGKAPFIIMEDADIDKAVDAAIAARYANCGQVCTCNERMYLHHVIADEFLEKFVSRSAALTIGDPMSDPDLGPKVSRVEVDKIKSIVDAGVEHGAQVLLEGGPLRDDAFDKGYWYAPTVLEVADNTSPLVKNEVFGPVATALRVKDFAEATLLANDSEYGLSAYLFTRDINRLMRASQELKFGEIYFNRTNGEQVQGFHTGWRRSGVGGEDGKYGLDRYFRKQTTYVNYG